MFPRLTMLFKKVIAACDPYWNKVVLAMHMSGSNGSTTFTDLKGHTTTSVGPVTISGNAAHFSGISYIEIPSDDSLELSGTPFTIEAFVRRDDTITNMCVVSKMTSTYYDARGYQFLLLPGAVYFEMYRGGGAADARYMLADTGLTRNHVSICSDGSNLYASFNGIVQNLSENPGFITSTGTLRIGLGRSNGGDAHQMLGSIDNLRITKGVARYTSNFTPPTEPFASTQCAISAQWYERASAGSRAWFGAAGSSNGQNLYAVVATSGYLYRSTDAGITWIELTAAGMMDWRGIACSADGAYVYAVAYGGGIFRSSDFGATWVSNGITLQYSGVSCSEDGMVVSVRCSGEVNGVIYVSNDGGAIFTSLNLGWMQWISHAVTPNGTVVWAADHGYPDPIGGLIHRGYTATHSLNGLANSPRKKWGYLASGNVSTCLALTTLGDELHRTTDGGTTWTQLTPPSGAWYYISHLGMTSYVLSGPNGETITTDAGDTWSAPASGGWTLTAKVSGSLTYRVATRYNGMIYVYR